MSGAQRDAIYLQIEEERLRQDRKWGEQNHPDGTDTTYKGAADAARDWCERAFAAGQGTWRHILSEEFFEAQGEVDPVKLREELIQVIAVATAWVECIDRRSS